MSRNRFVAILLLGCLVGLSNAGLIAVINTRLRGGPLGGRTLLWAFIALCVAMPLSRFLSNLMLLRLTQKALLTVRMQLCRTILQAPMQRLEQVGAHRLYATITNDVGTISGALTAFPILLMQLTVVIGCLAYVCWLSPLAFLAVLAFLVVGTVTYRLPMIEANRRFLAARTFTDAMFKGFNALTAGAKELKLHRRRRETFLTKGLEDNIATMQREMYLGTAASLAAASWGQVLFFILIGLLLFLLPNMMRLDAAVLSGYTLTLLYMMTPLEAVMNLIPQYSQARVAIDHIEGLGLDLLQAAPPEAAAGDATPAWRRLELRGVRHTYRRDNEDERFMLGPVDLTLSPGEVVFIIGGNGSGKTTLAKLLIGLYAPESGDVVLDERIIDDASRDQYRQLFSVVFTDFFLFDTLLGLEGPGLDAQALEYLRKLQLDKKIQVTDGRLSTVDLSQGQRKRLALLTAYLEDRSIYLFDEWAADQDPYFKQVFYHQLLPELKRRGKTVIVISHDDHYYDVADRIVKIDYGKIEYDRRSTPTAPTVPAAPAAPVTAASAPIGA
jgi:putative ATP-binding cassette transporter